MQHTSAISVFLSAGITAAEQAREAPAAATVAAPAGTRPVIRTSSQVDSRQYM